MSRQQLISQMLEPGLGIAVKCGRPAMLGLLSCLLLACGTETVRYEPGDAAIQAGRIAPFPMAGTAKIENGQPDDTWKSGPIQHKVDFQINYHVMSEALKDRLQKEIDANATKSGTETKTIRVSVESYEFVQSQLWATGTRGIAMRVALQLGDGKTVEKTATSSSFAGGSYEKFLKRVFDDAIAAATVDVLSDPEVLGFLARAGGGSGPNAHALREGSGDLKTKLRQLKEAYEQGLITKEEYESKRKVLLEGL